MVPALTEIGVLKVAVRQPVPVPVVVAVPSTVPPLLRRVTVVPVLVDAAQNLMATTFPARVELNRMPTVAAVVDVTAWVAGVLFAANSEKSAVVVVNVQVFAEDMFVPPVLFALTDAV